MFNLQKSSKIMKLNNAKSIIITSSTISRNRKRASNFSSGHFKPSMSTIEWCIYSLVALFKFEIEQFFDFDKILLFFLVARESDCASPILKLFYAHTPLEESLGMVNTCFRMPRHYCVTHQTT